MRVKYRAFLTGQENRKEGLKAPYTTKQKEDTLSLAKTVGMHYEMSCYLCSCTRKEGRKGEKKEGGRKMNDNVYSILSRQQGILPLLWWDEVSHQCHFEFIDVGEEARYGIQLHLGITSCFLISFFKKTFCGEM